MRNDASRHRSAPMPPLLCPGSSLALTGNLKRLCHEMKNFVEGPKKSQISTVLYVYAPMVFNFFVLCYGENGNSSFHLLL